jgi:acyl-coenzyme A synthetase/AMP-(fatty) acid ligase
LDASNPPFWRWFVGGRLNACVNCVDRQLAASGEKAAFIGVPEPENDETQRITYRDLHRRVNEFAALLRAFGGVSVGDRVTFHMPMVPELPVSMFACARLGVIHSEVFGGFSGTACGHRIAEIGKIARPKKVWIVNDMPKTRSGKIMRRVIAGISNFADVGDVSTLANPEIVDDIRHHVQSEKVAHGDVPRERSEKEREEMAAFGQAE